MRITKDEKWLREKYWEERLSQREIARFINSTLSAVQWAMKKFNIKPRTLSEAIKGISKRKPLSEEAKNKIREALKGSKSPNWKGGDRDYWSRIARGVWEEYWREEVPDGYIIHHIDRNIKNNDICNLALLTRSFHIKLHRRKK